MSITYQERKQREEWKRQRALFRGLAHRLRFHAAPASMIAEAEWQANSAKLKLWGWVGDVPPLGQYTYQADSMDR
jgi:predicted TIM-barrel fold metal-dependent hydrolase